MTNPDDLRREAEARLAEAREQLRAAEQAYRQVVPCQHERFSWDGDQFTCDDCGTERDDPRGCLHHRIDNDTWQCKRCGEKMIGQQREVETVLDAPNAAACTNPECSGDIHDPNCGNPTGLYVPDRMQEREVRQDNWRRITRLRGADDRDRLCRAHLAEHEEQQ
ncbi:DUF7459 domain-containing protein [Nocardia farcinica]|uniref:DUF7459 domain-containing protein n=1 Tax=Nocardia farcinica TaxID=37329 RepID=UPI002454E519|nr:hypothetical protein [Nocardia farcinica]